MSVSTNRVSDLERSSVEAYHSAGAGAAIEIGAEAAEASSPFVGQWRTLVSTTNWEKGRIVCQWRDSLDKAGATPAEFSDEAWAQLVGGVTGQHVGRLRRVFQRFGEVFGEYDGLYWSHFQAACEWDDAEMWLEGALQNGWSVSQTRAKRWETVGDGKPDPSAGPAAADELMEEGPVAMAPGAIEPVARQSSDQASGEQAPVREASDANNKDDAESSTDETGEAPFDEPSAPESEPARPFANLPELPDDVADAFEQFKLVILNHKLAGWAEVSRADIVGALESLKQLALAPSDSE